MLKIIADENIPYIKEACAGLGEVTALSGRKMTAETVKDADILFVRSITKVNEALLAGSRVKFVATATIGFDHVDRAYLDRSGRAFASAPGSNANSVGEYVAAALLWLNANKGLPLAGKTLGIVGVGNVGRRVEPKARALGLNILRNDPPRAEAEGQAGFVSLDELLAASDFVTLHVPLEKSGPHPTRHLANAEFFAKMKPGAAFFNCSRGSVCDGSALLAALGSGRLAGAVLDVWEGEPDISAELLAAVDLGTPHIAGYSFDGKVNGTEMIVNAARKHFGLSGKWNPVEVLPLPDAPLLRLSAQGRDKYEIARKAVNALYDIAADDANLRILLTLPEAERGAHFDNLRKLYPRRREFHNTVCEIAGENREAAELLAGLGFKIKDEG